MIFKKAATSSEEVKEGMCAEDSEVEVGRKERTERWLGKVKGSTGGLYIHSRIHIYRYSG